eukprot:TRINITY_DN19368_c0_g1_i1.p1 TRINITY_DN19368_c0_g1~~TRINITY_DN19368_c0_g1_i1.p1  ORF type:complete len:280 (+),score=22.80 TRINITY_DN19368_c0_g1_i1:94-933(+)
MTKSQFWGAPVINQFKTVPFLLGVWIFGISSCHCAYSLYTTLDSGMHAAQYTGKRKGRIIKAQYLGFGFWDIRYAWKIGPRDFVGERVFGSGLDVRSIGEFLLPSHRLYDKVTKVGSEVTVHYKKGGDVAGGACLDTGIHWPIASLSAFSTVTTLLGACVCFSRFVLMVKFGSLHSTIEGLTLLKKAELHQLSGAKGPSPLDAYMSPFYTPKKEVKVWSRAEHDLVSQRNYDNVHRPAQALELEKGHAAEMSDLRSAAAKEEAELRKAEHEVTSQAKNA